MKKKKQYVFGNSNYRKMNVETKEEIWFHLEKDKEGDTLCFIANSNDIKSCFEKKKAKGDCSEIVLCSLKCIGNVKDFCNTANAEPSKYRNMDDFFNVHLVHNREFFGKKLADDFWVAFIFC